MQLKGSLVALVTPMQGKTIDFQALKSLVEWHLANKTDGLVILGTTGESATITKDERKQVIETVVKAVDHKIPVVVGTGTNATASTIELTLQAQQLGADAALVVTPYYNKPSQKGLIAHYETLASASSLPLILYNVPGRTGCDMQNDTVLTLAQHPNIIGLKDATAELDRLDSLKLAEDFLLFSGDDSSSCEFLLKGGHGVISVTANICPALMRWMCAACRDGDAINARAMNESMVRLHDDLFVESNPVPVKWLLSELGAMPSSSVRLPLVELSETHYDLLKRAWELAEADEMNLEND